MLYEMTLIYPLDVEIVAVANWNLLKNLAILWEMNESPSISRSGLFLFFAQ